MKTKLIACGSSALVKQPNPVLAANPPPEENSEPTHLSLQPCAQQAPGRVVIRIDSVSVQSPMIHYTSIRVFGFPTLCVLEAPLHPGMRQKDLVCLILMQGLLPHAEYMFPELELCCWPEEKVLLKDADVYSIVVKEGQQLFFRPRPGLKKRYERWKAGTDYRRD